MIHRSQETVMRIEYLSNDDVNQQLAVQLADQCGATLEVRSFEDPPSRHAYDFVVYDLDYLPATQRDQILGELLARPVRLPLVVHSFNLQAKEIAGLEANGVRVFCRLGLDLFLKLRRLKQEIDRQPKKWTLRRIKAIQAG
jgi:hypothetical protein